MAAVASELGMVGEAFVRIRADMRGFAEDVNQGVRRSLKEVSTATTGSGLTRATEQVERYGVASQRAGAQALEASREIRTATEQNARDTVAASVVKRRALEADLVAYREIAAAAKAGSVTEVEANRLAANSARQLGVELKAVETQSLATGASFSKIERGALAGSGALRGMGRSVAFASLSFIGAYGLVGAIRSSIEAVNDLDNQTVRSVTVFRNSAPTIQDWAETTGRSLGLAKESALGTANAFGTIFSAAGVNQQQGVRFSEDLTKVAAAISLAAGQSSSDRATQALRVGLAGRGRALRQYGIILDETSLKAKALDLGIVSGQADPTKTLLAQRRLGEAIAQLQLLRADPKSSGLQVARAEDAVTVAQDKLRKAVAGTVPELNLQQKAIAAHAIIMEQGARFVDRYGASLDTAAGRSRRFHEGVQEIKEEVGTALFPAFVKAEQGITSYVESLTEGGSRHEQFVKDLHDAEQGANALYQGLKLLGEGFQFVSSAVGGIGNLIEILGFAYLANKALVFADAVKTSRLALLLLGTQADATATGVVASEGAMTAGMVTFGNTTVATSTRVVAAEEAMGGSGLFASGRMAALGAGLGALAGRVGGLAAAFVALKLVTDQSSGEGVFERLLRQDQPSALGPLGIQDQTLKLLGVGQGVRDVVRRGTLDFLTGGTAEIGRALFGFGKRSTAALPDPIVAAKKLRENQVPEQLIYQAMRKAGYTRHQTESAIVQTREHPGGATLAPSPEDVRFEQHDGAAATAAGTNTGQNYIKGLISSLKTGLAQTRAQIAEVDTEIAQTVSDNAKAMADAIRQAADAERQSILSAKQNLIGLGSSLAEKINELLDKTSEQGDSTDPNSPLAKRLRHLQALIRQGGATPELIQESKRVQAELDAQQNGNDDDRRARVQRRLADLTAEFDAGKISLRRFNRELTAILRSEGVSYRAAGRALGFAFAQGFRVNLLELRQQAQAIAQTPAGLRRIGTGFETQVVRPLETIREQNRNIANIAEQQRRALYGLTQRRHELLLEEQKQAHQLARVQARNLLSAVRDLSPGGGGGGGGGRRRLAPSPEDVRGAAGSGLHGAGRRDLVPDLLDQAKTGARNARQDAGRIIRVTDTVAGAVELEGNTARRQRANISSNTHETNVILRRLETTTRRGNVLTRQEIAKLNAKPKPKKRPSNVAAQTARQAGENNLT